jgi:hypothetical protein
LSDISGLGDRASHDVPTSLSSIKELLSLSSGAGVVGWVPFIRRETGTHTLVTFAFLAAWLVLIWQPGGVVFSRQSFPHVRMVDSDDTSVFFRRSLLHSRSTCLPASHVSVFPLHLSFRVAKTSLLGRMASCGIWHLRVALLSALPSNWGLYRQPLVQWRSPRLVASHAFGTLDLLRIKSVTGEPSFSPCRQYHTSFRSMRPLVSRGGSFFALIFLSTSAYFALLVLMFIASLRFVPETQTSCSLSAWQWWLA